MADAAYALELTDVSAGYGDTVVIESVVLRLKPGETVRFTVAREKELRDFSAILAPNPYAIIRIVPVEKPTDLQKKIYESWIGHPWPEKK